MALRIVVYAGGSAGAGAREAAVAFDTPRLVIGRGDGCDLRLPDPSVSHRHCSIRQRGAEQVLVDEGSTNGTYVGRTRLQPQTPHAIRSGDLVRIGRVWVELFIDAAPVMQSAAAAAKDLAVRLVTAGLAAQGEDGRPCITVREGPDAAKKLTLAEAGRRYVAGRGKDNDWVLDDANASRRHVGFELHGDHVFVTDMGSKAGTLLEGEPVSTDGATIWRPGQVVNVGDNRMVLEHPALEALADLERCPDERIRPDETFEPPEAAAPAPSDGGSEEQADGAAADGPTDAPAASERAQTTTPSTPAAPRTWGFPEALVVLIALGILAASAAGLWFLLRG